MSDTVGTVPIVNGQSVTVYEVANQTTVGAQAAVMPFMAIWLAGNPLSSNNPMPVADKPGSYTLISLDVSMLATSGTAYTVLQAGHSTAGGFITTNNPSGMVVNQRGTASLTIGGDNVFVAQGQVYSIAPTSGAVSVIASAANTIVSGYGYQ